MKKEHSILIKRFQEYLDKGLDDFQNHKGVMVIYPYKKPGEKIQITAGLIFWQFVREVLREELSMSFSEVREFLAIFVKGEKKEFTYIGILAMIESLPDLVWRKLLWRENIDLMSYESFLRRLNYQQEQAIIDNYNDLFSADPKLPRVFKKSLRDRVKILFGQITVDKLLQTEYNEDDQRNKTKGAYAFNLLSLDFGFSLYPKGKNDDTVITNKKFTRFLSIKAHINDFIVNMEDGKYFWLYKSARSNYAFNPGKEIRIKDHICPGFWATLIRHAIFWIVSPLAVLVSAVMVLNYGFISEVWIPTVAALPNIIWLTVAFFRLLLSPLSKIKIKAGKKTKKILTGILKAAAIIIWVRLVIKFIIWFYPFFGPKVGYFLTVLFIGTLLFYIVFMILNMWKKFHFEYDEIPSFVRFIVHAVLFSFVLVVLEKYVALPAAHFFAVIANSIWQWYTSDLIMINWLIAFVVFIIIFIRFCNVFFSDEKEFVKYEKVFRWLTIGFLLASIAILGAIAYKDNSFDLYNVGVVPVLIFCLIFMLFIFSILMMTQVNYKNIDEREVFSCYVYRVDGNLTGISFKSFLTKLRKSSWFTAVKDEEKWSIVDQIGWVASHYFPESATYRTLLGELIIENGNVAVIKLLWNRRNEIKRKIGDSDSLKLEVLSRIISGMSIEDAVDWLYEKETSLRKFEEKVLNFFETLFTPVLYIIRGIDWVFRKTKEFFLTLKDLWSLFNKLCPYVSRPEELE